MNIIKTPSFEIAANIKGDEESQRIAILMPGRLDTKDYANFTSHVDHLSKLGFLAVAIDPPGTWDSPGPLTEYSMTNYLKAVDELIDYFGNRPTMLLGHSRGGATAMVASRNPAVSALVLVNSSYGNPTALDPSKLENGLLREHRDIPPGNVRTTEKKRFDLPVAYFDDAAKYDPLAALKDFKGPKLLIHATEDEFRSLEEVRGIYDSLNQPKMFLQIDGSHDYRLFTEAIQAVNKALGQFIDKYLQLGSTPTP